LSLLPHYPLATLLPWLGLGPALGLLAMRPLLNEQERPRH